VLGACLLALAAAETLHMAAHSGGERRAEMRTLAGQLGLTDLTLFTEARYTRHLSLADLHSPFQDAPMALDHFPAGSLTRPPSNFAKSPVLTENLRTETGE
jgi:hypothetical protein